MNLHTTKHPERSGELAHIEINTSQSAVEGGTSLWECGELALGRYCASFDCVRQFDVRKCSDAKPHSAQDAFAN